MPAVLIDRDGTLNNQGGFCHPQHFEVAPWAVEAIRRFNVHGLKTALVTNQSGIFHGWFTREDLGSSFERLLDTLTNAGAHLDAIYYCPHGPADGCGFKKPSSGMLKRAANDLNVSLDSCFMVGDTGNDILAGHGAGCRTLLVQTGGAGAASGLPNIGSCGGT